MNRNTPTTIGQLKIGDRFHKAGDKKKEVWQKVEHKVKVTDYQTYGHFAKKDNEKFATPFKKETQVIFLRHAELI